LGKCFGWMSDCYVLFGDESGGMTRGSVQEHCERGQFDDEELCSCAADAACSLKEFEYMFATDQAIQSSGDARHAPGQ